VCVCMHIRIIYQRKYDFICNQLGSNEDTEFQNCG
jgi:hypothetical protein